MTGAESAGSNLATLDAETRMYIEADKIACMIRQQVKGMGKRERQIHAQQALAKLPGGMREIVLEQMRVRADASRN